MRRDSGSVLVIVPTYNEPAELGRTVQSLLDENVDGLHIVAVNAGDPLPGDISDRLEEIRVSSDHYWTHCIDKGLQEAAHRDFTFVYLTNADTYALPGTVEKLIKHAAEHPKTVSCAPAYIEVEKNVQLLYSHQDPMGPLVYGKLVRPWKTPTEAPLTPTQIVLTGGQGVLFPTEVAREFRVDTANFPHYASDHDLWLQLRAAGWKLELVPGTGVVNQRILSAQHATGLGAKLKKLWWRMSSDKTPESWRIMWRLRRKHQPLPLAVVTTLVSFGLRWTVGLPKILRRT